MRVLITGANGFLGSHLIDTFSKNGYQVIAGVRKDANLEKINLNNCSIVHLDYRNIESLISSLNGIQQDGNINLIIHNAAITVAKHRETFFKINTDLSDNLIQAIKKSNVLSNNGKIAYISSLAARGPLGKELPVSAYGESKLATEKLLKGSDLPYLIFRPTGIYGPKDKDFITLFNTCKKGLYPLIGKSSQKISMIHVEDVAESIESVCSKFKNEIVHLSDNKIYDHIDFKNAISNALGKKVFLFKLPLPIAIFFVRISSFLSKNPFMTVEKLKEITDNWGYNFSDERKKIPLKIKYDLHSGIKQTLNYYLSKNQL